MIWLKTFDNFNNGIERFEKIQSCEMKLEEAKNQKLQNIFKSCLNEISRGRFKSKELKSALENTKLLYESQEAVIKSFNNCFSMTSESKHKAKYGEGLKILIPKQIPQRLLIALAKKKRAIHLKIC